MDSLLEMMPPGQQQHPTPPGASASASASASGSLGGRLTSERVRLVAELRGMGYREELLSYARGEWGKVAEVMAGEPGGLGSAAEGGCGWVCVRVVARVGQRDRSHGGWAGVSQEPVDEEGVGV